jgi:hypothetical protein
VKITAQEFRNITIKTYPYIFRILILFRVSSIQITDRDIWKNNNDYEYKIREINPYNPLSYIVLLLVVPIGLIVNGFNKESFNDIKKLFKNK